MRSSTVLSLSPQLVFPGEGIVTASHFHPSLMFTVKGGAYQSGRLAKAKFVSFGHNTLDMHYKTFYGRN
jgi:hypothetical protein